MNFQVAEGYPWGAWVTRTLVFSVSLFVFLWIILPEGALGLSQTGQGAACLVVGTAFTLITVRRRH